MTQNMSRTKKHAEDTKYVSDIKHAVDTKYLSDIKHAQDTKYLSDIKRDMYRRENIYGA